jgi:hypothetical protein
MFIELRHRSPGEAKRVHCARNSCLVTAVCVALLVSMSLPAKRAFAEEKAPPPPVPPIELKASTNAEFKNCSDAAMGCEAAGSGDVGAKDFEAFKKKFKKRPKDKDGKVKAQICDIVVYDESAGAPPTSPPWWLQTARSSRSVKTAIPRRGRHPATPP